MQNSDAFYVYLNEGRKRENSGDTVYHDGQ